MPTGARSSTSIIDRLDAARYYLFDWSTVVRPA